MDNYYIVISRDGEFKGIAYEDEDLLCDTEGCNGTQYVVTWEDKEVTIVCGKSLSWKDDKTAKII